MSNHYLLVDDARKIYFDCEKLLLLGGNERNEPDALHEQPFETWLRAVNWGDEPPERTDRYRLALPEAHAVYDFLVASAWKCRIVSLDSDDYSAVQSGYHCIGNIWNE